MIEVQILVTLQVENDGDEPLEEARVAAAQAVRNALVACDSRGLQHDALPDASVGFVDVEVMQTYRQVLEAL